MIIWLGLVLLLLAAPATAQTDTTPPPLPGPLTVGKPTLDPDGAQFQVTWEAVIDPPDNVPVPVYRWSAGFNDGSSPLQGAVAGTLLRVRLPYHASGAMAGFVCVIAEDGAGNVSPGVTCAGLTVPPRPATTHTIEYDEPTLKADGTPLQGLKEMRLYWRIDDGPETMVRLPASSPKGGLRRQFKLTVPAISGTLSVTLTAVDEAGNESGRTTPVTKVIEPPRAP
jgi:hypothetical protein